MRIVVENYIPTNGPRIGWDNQIKGEESNLQMKRSNQKRKSIKVRLLFVPLICVLVGVLMIGAISSYLTRDSLLAEMRENGFSSSQRFVNRIEDNTEAVKTMNEMLETQIRSVGNIIFANRDRVNDEYLTQLSEQTGINPIYLYNPAGTIFTAAYGEYKGWTVPEDHPIRDFMVSGAPELMEEIRADSETGNLFKYGYIRSNTGEFVQTGVSADRVLELTEKFGYQALIDELVSDENIVSASFIDKDLVGVADSNKDNIDKSYQDDETIKKVALEGEMVARELFDEVANANVYNVVYPVVINGNFK